jgi:hypothetical protein
MGDTKKGSCHLCKEEKNIVPIPLKCNETQRWRQQLLGNKWLHMNEEIAYTKIISCNKISELKKT